MKQLAGMVPRDEGMDEPLRIVNMLSMFWMPCESIVTLPSILALALVKKNSIRKNKKNNLKITLNPSRYSKVWTEGIHMSRGAYRS